MLLLFALLACATAADVTYDDLALKKCNGPNWSIHGLWPEYDQKSWPQFCDNSRYKDLTEAVIAPILPLMQQYWFSCGNDNWGFWVHEWQKHGTCQPLPPVMYFRRTIDLFIEAQKNNWYGCSSTGSELLLHVDKVTFKWTGKC